MVKVRHIAIKVSHLEKSLAFYREALRLTYVRTRDYETFQALDLTDGETNVTLLAPKGQRAPVRKVDDAAGLVVDGGGNGARAATGAGQRIDGAGIGQRPIGHDEPRVAPLVRVGVGEE